VTSTRKIKTPSRKRRGFFFVDKRYEISYQDFIKDRVDIISLEVIYFKGVNSHSICLIRIKICIEFYLTGIQIFHKFIKMYVL
jgi:hypothetical protein